MLGIHKVARVNCAAFLPSPLIKFIKTMSQSESAQLPPLVLKPQSDRRIKKGHAWIYSNEVDIDKTPLKPFEQGQLAMVFSAKGQALGQAFVNPNALICGRLVTRNVQRRISKRFIVERLKLAQGLRDMHFAEPYYRLVYGDSDFLPGVVIDRFGDDFVVQISVAGFDQMLDELVAAIEALYSPRSIIVRNDHGAREIEGLEAAVHQFGDVPEQIRLVENDTVFEIPAVQGQKTGWFYDHRGNRRVLQNLVKDKSVLDVFSYFGGWGVEAARAGAQQVTCVDSSKLACDGVTHNAELNSVGRNVRALRGKAIDVLKAMCEEKQKFQVVVLDPPAFIKRRKDQKAGEAAYRHMNELAIRLLEPGGILVSASCSMPLTNENLGEIVRSSARQHDRQAQLFYRGFQGADHPVHPSIPETEYLKAQFFRVLSPV